MPGADTVLDAGVCPVAGFQPGVLTESGVGGEALVAPAVDVGQRQLCPGVGVFAAHQHPHPRRPTGAFQVVQQPGEVGDLRAVAGFAVGVHRGGPGFFGQYRDRVAHLLSDREPDRIVQVKTVFGA